MITNQSQHFLLISTRRFNLYGSLEILTYSSYVLREKDITRIFNRFFKMHIVIGLSQQTIDTFFIDPI